MAILGNNDNTNNDDNKKKDDSNNPVSLSGSGSQAAPGRVANFSTGQQQASNVGSGRFTNLQKYLGANQGAGETMGNRISQKYDNTKEKQTRDINDQNQQIADNIKTGREALDEGSGYQDQLKNIEQGFNTFGGMDNRSGFDAARQQAIDFTTNPNFSRFQTIQGGNAIDNQGALNAQQNALMAGQDLSSFTQDRLNKINTDQGRYDLMKDAFGNKKNYSSGNARFDQLFLQNDPSNQISALSDKFNQGNLASNRLISDINTQGEKLNTLLDDESTLVGNIGTQARTTQDAFNKALYGEENLAKNLEFVNAARRANFDDLRAGLQGGTLSQEQVNQLDLGNINRYDPRFGGKIHDVRALSADGKMTTPGSIGAPEYSTAPNVIGTYNLLKDPNAVDQYIKQGKSAVSAQDITTEDDYNAYKALQAISGLDSGLVSGASQLGSSVLQGDKNLRDEIEKANSDFITRTEDNEFRPQVGNYWFNTTAPDMASLLTLRDQLAARGYTNANPFVAGRAGAPVLSTDLMNFVNPNRDLLDPLAAQVIHGANSAKSDNYQDRVHTALQAANEAMQRMIDAGYDRTIKVDPNKAAPKRYKGLL